MLLDRGDRARIPNLEVFALLGRWKYPIEDSTDARTRNWARRPGSSNAGNLSQAQHDEIVLERPARKLVGEL